MDQQEPKNLDESAPFNKLTPAEDERLSLLAEECAEVILAICKIQRHGYSSHHPQNSELPLSNRNDLEEEIGHAQLAISLLVDSEDINPASIGDSVRRKRNRIRQYLHHQSGN